MKRHSARSWGQEVIRKLISVINKFVLWGRCYQTQARVPQAEGGQTNPNVAVWSRAMFIAGLSPLKTANSLKGFSKVFLKAR